MDSKLFYGWLSSHFIKWIPLAQPVLFFLNGHSSHINFLKTVYFAHNNGVLLYCLPLNTTHVLQPCDVGFFGPSCDKLLSWRLSLHLSADKDAVSATNSPGSNLVPSTLVDKLVELEKKLSDDEISLYRRRYNNTDPVYCQWKYLQGLIDSGPGASVVVRNPVMIFQWSYKSLLLKDITFIQAH